MKVLAARFARLAGRLDHFGRFFDDFGADLLHAAGQQLAGVRFLVRIGRSSGDRAFQLIERWRCGAHVADRLPIECVEHNNSLGHSLGSASPSRKRRRRS